MGSLIHRPSVIFVPSLGILFIFLLICFNMYLHTPPESICLNNQSTVNRTMPCCVPRLMHKIEDIKYMITSISKSDDNHI